MGTYLHVGVVYRATFGRSDCRSLHVDADMLQNQLSRELDLNLFTMHEVADGIEFLINESVLVAEFPALLAEQFDRCRLDDGGPWRIERDRKRMDAVTSHSTSLKDLVDLAEAEGEVNDILPLVHTKIYEPLPIGNYDRIDCRMHILSFFSEGKFFIEDEQPFLSYFGTTLRRASACALGGALRAYIE